MWARKPGICGRKNEGRVNLHAQNRRMGHPAATTYSTVYLFPRIDGSWANFIRNSPSGPPGAKSDTGRPKTSRPNRSSSSWRTVSLSIWGSGRRGSWQISSKRLAAFSSCFGFRAVTSMRGMLCYAVFPTLPLPDCCLLECHHRKSIPSDVFAHTTMAFSCSADTNLIDCHARPPIVLREVNCIPVDCTLERKLILKWQSEAVAQTP